VGENAIGSIRWPITENPPIDAKISQISRTHRVLSQISFHGNGCRSEKNAVCSIQWHILETPLPIGAKISYTSRIIANFVPNYVAMATGVGRGKMQLSAFDGPSLKTPYRRKNLAKISYTSRVIASFVPNFVAMATWVGRGKMQLAAFDGPSPKTPL